MPAVIDPGGGAPLDASSSPGPIPQPGPPPGIPGQAASPYNQVWLAWAKGVLNGIGAPATEINLSNLWAWTTAESPILEPMRWNNPLNTTQPGPGATDVNSAGVKSFPSVDGGINASVQTLLNGYYPALVEALRSSTPRQQWSPSVLANITKWGTNTSFANSAVPGPTSQGGGAQPPPSVNAPFDPFGIGAAFSNFGSNLNRQLVGGLQVVLGAVLMLAGIAVLVLMATKGAAPAAAKIAALGTPVGRVAAALPKPRSAPVSEAPVGQRPTPAQRSPEAQAAVAAAKAGRGSKLSPQVKSELSREPRRTKVA